MRNGQTVAVIRHRPDRGERVAAAVTPSVALREALRRLADGETVIDPTIVSEVMRRRRPGLVTGLTEREQEVLALVAEGLSNQAIAQRLVINERTVETHTTRIFTKLGLEPSPDVHRRVKAVLAATSARAQRGSCDPLY